jgi:gliding motility-associated-like protein
VTCYGSNDGKILAIADSGTAFFGIPPEYLYTVNNQTTGDVVYRDTIAEALVEDLNPGVYNVTVADLNGCIDTSGSIFVSQPTDQLTINLDSVDQQCSGDNGQVISNVDGGTSPYTYIWSNGVSGSNASIIGLSPGIYSVDVVDLNNCVVDATIRVNASNEIFLPGNFASFDTTICFGLTIPLEIEEKLGFTYIWRNNNDTLLDLVINNLTNESADIDVTASEPINIYTLSITDPTCGSYDIFATININFIDPMASSNPTVEYGEYPVVLSGDNIELYSGNSNAVEYIWRWINDTIANNNGNITVQDLSESAYYYLEMRDNQGCVGYDSIYVVVGVKPYDAITPNNDGFNDSWTPLDIESYENALVQVFNRWGSLVFESKGGANYQAWDGTNNGEELTVGTYYYIIDLKTSDEPQTGPITIIR